MEWHSGRAQFGTMTDITSGQGPQLTLDVWMAVAKGLGVKLNHTTAYNLRGSELCKWLHEGGSASQPYKQRQGRSPPKG